MTDERRSKAAYMPHHNGLLIAACVMVFLVSPVLMTWSLSDTIHTHAYGQGVATSNERSSSTPNP